MAKINIAVLICAALLSRVCSVPIQSWAEWKTKYNARVETLGTAALIDADNVLIQGETEPGNADVKALWLWHKSVDASFQTQANEMMTAAWTGMGGKRDTDAAAAFQAELAPVMTAAADFGAKNKVYQDLVASTVNNHKALQTKFHALTAAQQAEVLEGVYLQLLEKYRAAVLTANDATATPDYTKLLKLIKMTLSADHGAGAQTSEPMYAQSDAVLQGKMRTMILKMMAARLT